jgi:hypothetical protein
MQSKGELPSSNLEIADIKETHVFSSYQPSPGFVIFLWVSISRRNLSHPDGNRFMGKTLQRFQRSGSKSNASIILKVSFQRRESFLTFVILYQKCRALACQPTTVIEHSTLFASRIESAPVLSVKPSIPTVHFVLRIPTRLTGRCPDQKLNFTTGDGFSHVIFFS